MPPTSHTLPTQKLESWKFTPLARAVQLLQPTPPCTSLLQLEQSLPVTNGCQLVFHNGILVPELSQAENLPHGLTLTHSPSTPITPTRDSLDTLPTPQTFQLRANGNIPQPLHLIHLATGNTSTNRIEIHLTTNTHLNLIEHHVAPTGTATWHHLTTHLTLENNAHLTHSIIQTLPQQSLLTRRTHLHLAPHAQAHTHSLQAGSHLARTELHTTLTENCTFHHTALTLGKAEQTLDTTLTTTHLAEHNQTHIRNRNLLTDSAHAIFQGKFYVAKAAQKTNAYMHCHNLLLSETARTSHKPELEIYADDVKCSHGAATGGLNPMQLFYLQARGLTPQAARALLVQGAAEEFIHQFPPHLHHQLNQTLHQWLHGTPEETPIDFGTLQGDWLNDNPQPFKIIQGGTTHE